MGTVLLFSGCDLNYFPSNSSLGLRYEMKNDQNGMVKLNYILPEDELNGSVKVSVTLIYEDNNWKVDSFQLYSYRTIYGG
jgi:hypothetical protein